MEELAKLEEERGNPASGGFGTEVAGGKTKGSRATELGASENVKKRERIASNEMCTFLILNYFFLAADTCKYDCISVAVRKCESGGNNCANNCGYGGSSGVLQGER